MQEGANMLSSQNQTPKGRNLHQSTLTQTETAWPPIGGGIGGLPNPMGGLAVDNAANVN